MALRIGALLLAGLNFLNASVIGPVSPNEGHYRGYGIHYHHGSHTEPSPVPGVIVKNYVIGAEDCGKGCPSTVKVSSESRSGRNASQGRSDNNRGSRDGVVSLDKNINTNKNPVNFKQIKYVESDDKNFIKAPITIVNVPLVSTAATTEHKVAKNYNIDNSNLPEDRQSKNISAKSELLSYDNLLTTAVKPVRKVSVELKKT
jgi:hypothetical protein